MANTVIQHKRTATSGKLPNTTNSANLAYIAPGQIAVNMTDQTLVSSDGTNLFYVGANVPTRYVGGVFLANSTVVNLGSASVYANGALGSAAQVLTSNGSATYWVTPNLSAVNTSAQYTFTNTETFAANVVVGGNLSINTTAGYATIGVGNSTGNSTVNAYGLTVLANSTSNLILSATVIDLNVNSTVGFSSNATQLVTAGLANVTLGAGMLYSTANVNVQGVLAVNSTQVTVATVNAFGLGTSSVAANGYTYLPNKLLLQWGSLLVNSTTAAQTWPTAFATNAYSITATANTISTNVAVTTCNVSKFTVITATTANVRVFWTAMGQ